MSKKSPSKNGNKQTPKFNKQQSQTHQNKHKEMRFDHVPDAHQSSSLPSPMIHIPYFHSLIRPTTVNFQTLDCNLVNDSHQHIKVLAFNLA